jgi:hypothetical protein
MRFFFNVDSINIFLAKTKIVHEKNKAKENLK